MGLQEDDIVHAVAERWRLICAVLAAGASQAALCFHAENGRRKAPDIVACTQEAIVVCEAKVRAAHLLGGPRSDAEQLRSLCSDRARSAEFSQRVRDLAKSVGLELGPSPAIVGVLIAGTAFSSGQIAASTGLVCIEVVDADDAVIVAGAGLLPLICVAALGRPQKRVPEG